MQSTVTTMMRPSPLPILSSACSLTGRHGPPPRRRRVALAAALALLGLVTALPASAGSQPVPRTLEFDIARKGDVVGHHRISFSGQGDKLIVRSDLEIEVEML